MKVVIANWKMNLLSADASAFAAAFKAGYTSKPGTTAGIAPPFTLLKDVVAAFAGTDVKVFAQNAYFEPKGAFTGEVSFAQVKDTGAAGVILGHSERRALFGETDAALVKKLQAAWAHDLLPVLCIGETLAQRDANETLAVLKTQMAVLAESGQGPLVLAYEPVWAIGTGRVATTEQVAEVHAFIHQELQALWGDKGLEVPVQYGGSVNPENFEGILKVPHVHGGLVGGAALDPAKFLKLVQQAQA